MPRCITKTIFILPLLITVAGCKVKVDADFASAFPQDRLAAIADARKSNDPATIKPLISLLNSDDPLIRLVASDTLFRITGEDMGYDYAQTRTKRQAAIDRWIDWYEQTEESGK
ncbi:MAG: hypothetical protein Phyf2KO_10710 [Phycisphaerales bacterium]